MRVFVIKEDSPIFIKEVFKILPLQQSQHDAVTLKRATRWIAFATDNIHMKTSQEQK